MIIVAAQPLPRALFNQEVIAHAMAVHKVLVGQSGRMRPPQAEYRRVASGVATGIPVGRLTPYRLMYHLFSPTRDVSQLLTH